MAIEKLEAEVLVKAIPDKWSFDKASDYVKQENKRLNSEMWIKLSLDLANLRVKQTELRQLLAQAKKDWDKEAQITIQAKLETLREQLNTAVAELKNFSKRGNTTVSWLDLQFKKVTDEIQKSRTEMILLWKSTWNLDKLLQKANDLEKEFKEWRISIQEYGKELWNIKNQSNWVWWTFDFIKWKIWGLTTLIWWLAIWAWLKELWTQAIFLWDKFEQASISFETMLWSAERAQLLLQDLSTFAQQTPFDLVWIRDTAKQLLAVWIEVDNIIPTMKALWDVASMLWWPDVFGRLVYAFWQVKSAWKLTWNELRQFTETWIPLLEELSKQFWVSTAAIRDMISEWKVWFNDVQIAFANMTKEWWKFANWQAVQMDTLTGKWWKFKDEVNATLESIWTSLLPFSKKVVDIMSLTLDFIKKAFTWLLITAQIVVWWSIQAIYNMQIAWARVSWWIAITINWIIWSFKDFVENTKILASNIWVAFWTIPWKIGEFLNKWIQKIESFLNKASNWINNFAKKLWFEWDLVWNISLWRLDTWTSISEYKNFVQTARNNSSEINAEILWNIDTQINAINKEKQAHKIALRETLSDYVSNNNQKKELNTDFVDSVINWNDNIIDESKKSWKKQIDEEKKKAEELQKLYEQNYNEDIKLAEQKAKRLEEIEKKKNNKLKTQVNWLDDMYKEATNKYKDYIDDSKKAIDDLNKKIDDSLESFKKLNEELNKLETWKTSDLSSRFIKVWDEIKKLQDDLQKMQVWDWISLNYAQQFWLDTLKQIWWDSEIWWYKVSDLIKVLELNNELNSLLDEQKLLKQNLTNEEITEAQRFAWLNETQKILEKYATEKKGIEEQIYMERIRIWELEANRKTEEEIYANLLNEQNILDENYKNLKLSIEQQITDDTYKQAQARIDILEQVRQKALETAEALRSAGVATVNAWNNQNSWSVDNSVNTSNSNNSFIINANISNKEEANNLIKQLDSYKKWIK